MNEVLEKFAKVLTHIEGERGRFALFGLFLRADSPTEAWDLVASAAWLDTARLEGMRYLAEQLGNVLAPEEMMVLSRIVPIETTDMGVIALTDWAEKVGLPVQVNNFMFSGTQVSTAHILAAHSDAIVVPNPQITTQRTGRCGTCWPCVC